MKNIRCLTGILIPATLFVGSLGICVYALIADPLYSGPVQHAKHITISSVNVTLTGHFGGGSIVFFNQDFPYQASITYGSQEGEGVRIKAFDWCGIQFYTLESTIHSTWWSFMISLWYPIIAFGILPVIVLFKQIGTVLARKKNKPSGEAA